VKNIRRVVRRPQSVQLLDALHRWFKDTLRQVSGKSELAVAIRYALSRSTALTRSAAGGNIEIDNNATERALRAVALRYFVRLGPTTETVIVRSTSVIA
jgi:transposase